MHRSRWIKCTIKSRVIYNFIEGRLIYSGYVNSHSRYGHKFPPEISGYVHYQHMRNLPCGFSWGVSGNATLDCGWALDCQHCHFLPPYPFLIVIRIDSWYFEMIQYWSEKSLSNGFGCRLDIPPNFYHSICYSSVKSLQVKKMMVNEQDLRQI